MKPQIPLLASAAIAAAADASVAGVPGVASYVVGTAFPTTVYSSYYGEALMATRRRQCAIARARMNTHATNQSNLDPRRSLSQLSSTQCSTSLFL